MPVKAEAEPIMATVAIAEAPVLASSEILTEEENDALNQISQRFVSRLYFRNVLITSSSQLTIIQLPHFCGCSFLMQTSHVQVPPDEQRSCVPLTLLSIQIPPVDQRGRLEAIEHGSMMRLALQQALARAQVA